MIIICRLTLLLTAQESLTAMTFDKFYQNPTDCGARAAPQSRVDENGIFRLHKIYT